MARQQQDIEAAAKMLRQFAGAEKMPTDIEKIVSYLGGKIIPTGWSPVEAKVFKKGNAFEIQLAAKGVSPKRERFSIAHELGHIILHSGFLNPEEWETVPEGEGFYRLGTGRMEYEANDFAAALLMPADIFTDDFFNCTADGYVDIEKLASIFDVSIEAAKTRGRWLGLLDW